MATISKSIKTVCILLVLLLCISNVSSAQTLDSGESPYPILFVHGLYSSDKMWSDGGDGIIPHLQSLGYSYGGNFNSELETPKLISDVYLEEQVENSFGDLWTINFEDPEYTGSNRAGIYLQSKAVDLAIDRILNLTQKEKIILVGHSMGGLAIAGYMVADLNNDGDKDFYDSKVAKVVTMGTPFGGAHLSTIKELAELLTFNDAESDPASRDLSKNYSNHRNVFLFGGNESELAPAYDNQLNDVNYNGQYGVDDLKAVNNIDDWPRDLEYFWLIGSGIVGLWTGSSNSDGVVIAEDQYLRGLGNSKTIKAGHLEILGSCSEAQSFDAIIEALDESSNFNNPYIIKNGTNYNGFLTVFDDFYDEDIDLYQIQLESAGEITIDFSSSPVETKLELLAPDKSTIISDIIINPDESGTIKKKLVDSYIYPANFYIRISGQVEPSDSGFDILNSACESKHFSARQPYIFNYRIEEFTEPNLANGSVTPHTGNTDTNFEFSVDYKSPDNIAPNTVSVSINGVEYPMATSENTFDSGVTYSYSPEFLLVGNYEYYFTANVAGEILRFPESGTRELNVSQSAKGWDLAVSESSSITPRQPIGGSSISVNAIVDNVGENEYNEVNVTARLLNPSGSTIASDEGTIYNLSPGYQDNLTLSLGSPNLNDEGMYQVIISANGSNSLDENGDNNAVSRSFYIGELLGTTHFRAVTEELVIPQGGYFWIENENGATYQFDVPGVDVDRGQVIIEYNGDYEEYFLGDLAIYPDKDVAAHITGFNSYYDNGQLIEEVYMYLLVASSIAPQFPSENLYLKQGNLATTNVSLPSGYNYSDFEIIDEDNYENQIESWMTIQELSGGDLEITWDIPSDEPTERHEIYMMTEYSSDLPTYSKLYVNIIPPEPTLSSISSSNISADDTIEIGGSHFGNSTGTVNFDDIKGIINSWSNNSISVTVPEGISDGILTVTNSHGTSNGKSYRVISSTGDPEIVQAIPDQSMQAGETTKIADLNNTFWDPNGDALEYQVDISYSGLTYDQTSLNNRVLVLTATESSYGSHTVSVTATDADNASVIDEFTVAIEPNLVPDFTVEADSGSAPFAVQFTDQSVPSEVITSWKWDFNNDGIIDSEDQNPSYTFQEPGSYSVKLIVGDGQNSKSELKSDFITVQQPVDPIMSINADQLENPIEYQGGEFTVQIDNTGVGTLAWEADAFENWIQVEQTITDKTTGSGVLNITIPPYDYCGDIDRFGLIELMSSNAVNEVEIIEIFQKGIEYDNYQYEEYNPTPDLKARSITAPSVLQPGDSIEVNTIYDNVGDLIANSGWTGSIYLTKNNTSFDLYENNAIEIASFTEQQKICYRDPDVERVVPVSIPDTLSNGDYFLALYLDSGDIIWEKEDENFSSSTNNNVFSDKITVSNTIPIAFEGTFDPITLRTGDTRNQVAETYLHEDIASLFSGGSGSVTFTASSSDASMVEADINEGNLLIKVVGAGINEEVVTVTITATDENENSAEGSIEVTVHPAFGDLNADGRVNSFDASRVLQNVVELYEFNEIQQEIADISSDGRINSYDASLILQYAVELIDQIPVGSPNALMASSTVEEVTGLNNDPVSWGDIQEKGERLELPLHLTEDGPVYAIDFSGSFDNHTGSLEEISYPELPDGWITSHRITKDGKVMIALAGATPFDGEQIATLSFTKDPYSPEINVVGTGYVNGTGFTLDQIVVQEIIDNFAMEDNFPNPFNPSTTVRYQLPAVSDVKIEMYNIAGQRVMQVFDANQNAGRYTLNIDMSAFSSGVYFIRMIARSDQETFVTSSKMTLIK
jgi:PKD repeat protein/pimeloyl-ACP methyl ester carboxylesterase